MRRQPTTPCENAVLMLDVYMFNPVDSDRASHQKVKKIPHPTLPHAVYTQIRPGDPKMGTNAIIS